MSGLTHARTVNLETKLVSEMKNINFVQKMTFGQTYFSDEMLIRNIEFANILEIIAFVSYILINILNNSTSKIETIQVKKRILCCLDFWVDMF